MLIHKKASAFNTSAPTLYLPCVEHLRDKNSETLLSIGKIFKFEELDTKN